MKWLVDILPFIVPILAGAGGWIFGRRLREAQVVKAEAEARKILADAEKALAEADTEEARNMSTIIGAWQTLFETTKAEMESVRQAQAQARVEHDRVLLELRRYKRGVTILIGQLRELGVEPRWTPEMES